MRKPGILSKVQIRVASWPFISSSLFQIIFAPFAVAAFYTMAAGSLITYDGNQYLATAYSIAHRSLTSGYIFGRPPFYPFFLSVILSISNSDRFLIFVQVFISTVTIMIAFEFLRELLLKRSIMRLNRIVVYFLILSPTITGYGTTVLQQSLFVSESSLLLAFLFKLLLNPEQKIFYFMIAICIPVTILTGQGMLPFVIGILLVLSYTIARRELNANLRKKINSFALLTLIALTIPLTFISWTSFEHWGLRHPGTISLAVPSGGLLRGYPSYFMHDPELAASDFFDNYVSQSGLAASMQVKGLISPERRQTPMFFENRVHAESSFSNARHCGIVEGYNIGSWYKYSTGVLKQSCAPLNVPHYLNLVIFGFGSLMAFCSFMFLPIGIYSLCVFVKRRDWQNFEIVLVLTAPGILLRLSYIALGFSPDRYALPVLPSTLFLLAFMLHKVRIGLEDEATEGSKRSLI